jgi:3-oxoacyl-[acyl-carrier protein] reductase
MPTEQQNTLKDKVAIVTGGARGMGFAISSILAKNGVKVVICDIDGKNADNAAQQLKEQGGTSFGCQVDVTKEHDIKAVIAKVKSTYGNISILINNAGILRPTKVDAISYEEWKQVLDVNLNGSFLCSQAVLEDMKKENFGRIINMSSSAGRSVSTLGGAHYTASKAGVLGLTRAMAKEISKYGITVNAVCPGLIDTEMVQKECSADMIKQYENSFPIPRLGTPEEVAQLVLFLCKDSYITGAALDINGGDLMM